MRHLGIGVLVLFVILMVVNSSNASRHDPNYKTLDSLALLLKGFDAAKAKEYDRAISLYSRVINIGDLPANLLSTTHRAKGDAFYLIGFVRKAIDNYGRAIKHDPQNIAAYINRGNVRTHQGKFREALGDLNAAITLDPHEPLAFQNRGNLHFYLGQFEMASTDYRRSLELDPSDIFSAFWL